MDDEITLVCTRLTTEKPSWVGSKKVLKVVLCHVWLLKWILRGIYHFIGWSILSFEKRGTSVLGQKYIADKKTPGFKSDRQNCIFIDKKKKKLWVKILFLIFLYFSLLLFKWNFSLQDKKNKLFFHPNRKCQTCPKVLFVWQNFLQEFVFSKTWQQVQKFLKIPCLVGSFAKF